MRGLATVAAVHSNSTRSLRLHGLKINWPQKSLHKPAGGPIPSDSGHPKIGPHQSESLLQSGFPAKSPKFGRRAHFPIAKSAVRPGLFLGPGALDPGLEHEDDAVNPRRAGHDERGRIMPGRDVSSGKAVGVGWCLAAQQVVWAVAAVSVLALTATGQQTSDPAVAESSVSFRPGRTSHS